MKSFEEVKKAIEEYFNSKGYGSKPETMRVSSYDGGKTIEVYLKKEYEFVEVSFADLKRLSEICKTEEISPADYNSSKGCETCDYGSSYEVTIRISNAVYD